MSAGEIAITAARGMLGRILVSDIGGVRTAVRLTEVEAYGGADDPASHAHRGPTPRNAVMFGPADHLYVYRSYGIHWCANVVCGPDGEPGAVLLRGGEPLVGVPVMEQRRGRLDHLADGPGKLTQALGITGAMNGVSVLRGPVRLEGLQADGVITATPRIGITRATERRWRFVWTPV